MIQVPVSISSGKKETVCFPGLGDMVQEEGALVGTLQGARKGTLLSGALKGTLKGALKGTLQGALKGTFKGALKGTNYRNPQRES